MDLHEQDVLKKKDDAVADYENFKDLISRDDEIRDKRSDDDKK
jgi:hypothetical protein